MANWERLGAGLWAATTTWLVVRASPADRVLTAAATAGLGLTILIGARLARNAPRFVDVLLLAVALAAVLVAIVAAAGPGLTDPFGGPAGDGNSRAAFHVLGAGAALALAARRPTSVARRAATIVAGALLVLPWMIGSRGGAIGSLVVVTGVLIGRRRAGTIVASLVLGGALIGTSALAIAQATGTGSQLRSIAAAALTDRRLELWADAVQLVQQRPLSGVGLGRFATASPTAQSDLDVGWAHHEPLQLAAEAGIPALVLAIAITVWIGIGLSGGGDRPETNLLLLTLAAIGAHACVDHVLREPLLLVGVAALAASHDATVRPRPNRIH